MRDLVDDLRSRLARVRQGGSESARKKHTDRGKLLVRDRVDRLLDPGSPFLELSPLAATGMYGARDGAEAVAADNRLPCLYLVDSGGAFLPMQDDVFPDREHFGRIFFNQANLSAQG